MAFSRTRRAMDPPVSAAADPSAAARPDADAGRSGHPDRLSTAVLLAAGLALLPAHLGAQQEAPSPADATGEGNHPAAREAAAEDASVVRDAHAENGVRAELSVEPLEEDGALREGERLRVSIRLTDRETGEPLEVEPPAAWIDFRDEGTRTSDEVCRSRIGEYLKKRMKRRAAVDLNSYYVLTLNRGNNISVLSPFFGMGTTQTVTTVQLPGEGADWVLSPDERRLFVTIPLRNLVAVVSTETWDVKLTIPVETRPRRIRLGPEEERLWVSLDGGGERGGVAVLDRSGLGILGTVRLGEGPHRVAFRPDGEVAFVASEGAGTVSVVDTRTLEVRHVVKTGPGPAGLDFAGHSDRLYVADREDGSVTVLDRDGAEVVERLPGTPGKTEVRFDPTGRWGFLLNPGAGEVLVLDADVDRIRHGFAAEGEPYRVGFTEGFAYVRSRQVPDVAMIALSTLGPDGGGDAFASDFRSEGSELTSDEGLRAVSFPAGQSAPAENGDLGPASPFAHAPHKHDAIYVAAPADKALYFYHYMEGMPTPSGTLKTYAFEPKAALSVGRRMIEEAPGRFSAVVEAPRAGPHDFVLAVDDPRLVHCFPFRVEAPLVASRNPEDVKLLVAPAEDNEVTAGAESGVRFRLMDRATEEARAGLDVRARLTSPTGFVETYPVTTRDDGSYEVKVRPPSPGVYYLSVAVEELRKGFRDTPPLVLRAGSSGSASRTAGTP